VLIIHSISIRSNNNINKNVFTFTLRYYAQRSAYGDTIDKYSNSNHHNNITCMNEEMSFFL
jgi:hypothetical protein